MGQQTKEKDITKIPITVPSFDKTEEEAVCQVLRSGWVAQGPKVKEFEKLFAEYIGMENAVAVSSCTTALHLALLVHNIGPGDEVLLPSYTYIATANAIEYVGAKPIFIDINPQTFTIDTKKITRYLKKSKDNGGNIPKAIIPVSLFGLCANMKTINEIAIEYNLLVIEDAACGIGAKRDGHYAGTEADTAVFSFHPRKTITTGEGGMIVTNDDIVAQQLISLRNHGASAQIAGGGSLLPEFDKLGYNYRMTDLQGAVGVAQMNKLECFLEQRTRAAARYDYLLQNVRKIHRPTAPENYNHAHQSYVCIYNTDMVIRENRIDRQEIKQWNIERNKITEELTERGIGVRQGTHAIHTLGYYKNKYGISDYDFPYSYFADRLSIALPLFPGITTGQQERVVEVLGEILEGF